MKQIKVNLATMFRLGMFQMGLGIMSILTLGILNRVMIRELAIPATIAAGVLAIHQLVSPARLWFGQLSDSKPIFGLHRTFYIIVGAICFTSISFLAVQVMWSLGHQIELQGSFLWNQPSILWTILLGLMFGLYGLALSSSSTPFAALLVDVSDEDNRSKIVAVAWSLLMVGIIIGGITGGILLKQLEEPSIITGSNLGSVILTGTELFKSKIDQIKPTINTMFIIVPLIVLGLIILGIWGIETRYSRYNSRSIIANREDTISLKKAIQILTASRQTGLFFSFLLLMTISLFMQEAVLEPYGGEIFRMPIGQTTQLNAYWGLGTLIGVSSTGFLVVPKIGKENTTKLGCALVSLCFILIILSGFTSNPLIFKTALFLFGLAAGITTTGAISLMLDLTAAETAGTFIGAWGVAQAIARGLATILGGVILDIGRFLFSSPLLAYGLVFAVQAIGMILAIGLLNRVNITEFKLNAKDAILQVIQGDLD